MDILLQIGILLVGFAMLVKGADWFVEGTAGIAEKFHIPQLVIGLTIVAMGTSAPEAAVSITAAIKGSAGITIGNVVGSNILNVLVILGITAVITRVSIQQSTLKYEIPYMVIITLVLLLMGYTGGTIHWIEGIILWILFILYLAYLFRMAKKGKVKVEKEDIEETNTWKLVLYGVIGGVLIVWGSNVAVGGATKIAEAFGLSQRFIGLTIVALGTSLPELVTSVTAAIKGKADIAIGNIVGSNLFNILFVIGTTSLITPVIFEMKFIFDTLVAVGAGILLWLAVIRHKELRRGWGIIFLLAYAGYFAYLIV